VSDNSQYTILVVDDEKSVRESIGRVLKKEGYSVSLTSNGHEALDILEKNHISVVMTDLRMPEMSGIELLEHAKREFQDIEVILITGHGTIEKAVEAMKLGAYDFITKPFKRAEILSSVRRAIEKHTLASENKFLREQLEKTNESRLVFIGESPQVQNVIKLVEKVAPLPSTVLITGESGTGKEIIARMIHNKSPRANRRFVAVNCGAISENIIESELFGHVKGSFTGATRDKEGLFKIASGGTLFLDEISTLPLNMQVKLLRALQEQEIRPVGSTRSISVDVRILAASNRNLQDEMEAGNFREDLYYRLNVVALNIPPLRERRDDIPHLIKHFIAKFNHELNKSVTGASPETIQMLMNYSWKGNVRELENAIEHAMILCDTEELRPENLPHHFFATKVSQLTHQQGLKESVMEFERLQITNTLARVDGDKKAAAELLGLSLSSLYRKMSELQLDVKEYGHKDS